MLNKVVVLIPKSSTRFYEIGLAVSRYKKAFNISKHIANKSFFFPKKKIRRIATSSASNIQLEVIERGKSANYNFTTSQLVIKFLCIFSMEK